jgi:predicted O-linked N-acetylglucosamine transferase (SPINDLY family)
MSVEVEKIVQLGLEYQKLGQMDAAVNQFTAALALDSDNVVANYSLAVIFFNNEKFKQALSHLDRAIKVNSTYHLFYETRAKIYQKLNRIEDGIIDELVSMKLSNSIITKDLSDRMILSVTENNVAIFIHPDSFNSIQSVIETCERLIADERYEEAIYVYRRYINLNTPEQFAALCNLGSLYSQLGSDNAARDCYENVIKIRPFFIQAYLNLGTILEKLTRQSEALKIWETGKNINQSLEKLDLDHQIKLLNNLGRLNEIMRIYDTAENYLYESLLLDGNQDGVLQHWIHLRQKQCKWPILTDDEFCRKPIEDMASPLSILSLTDSPEAQFSCSKRFGATRIEKFNRRVATTKRYGHDKIRIGYASSDLSMHAVSLLTVEMYELHDRNKFEIHAFCWSPEDGTAFRQRVRNSFDHFHPIGNLTDIQAADLIQKNEIDVLVDLQGLSGRARPNIIAQGAAPVQIAYLGYPGTTAIPYVDYVVADDFIFPRELANNFSEKPLYLPRVFQVSDSKRLIGERKSKSDFGIDNEKFIFCCFNNNFKFNEELFSIWLDIIKNTDNTILWILEDNDWSKKNLINFANQHGVSNDRLVFAGRIDPRDYLARFQVADIFLDTYPYNAGTTANDLLWAGLPLLTLSGSTYVSRMAGSLSRCMELDEQICSTLDEYRNKAIEFVKKPEKLAQLRRRVRENHANLFNTKRIVSEFETAIHSLIETNPT